MDTETARDWVAAAGALIAAVASLAGWRLARMVRWELTLGDGGNHRVVNAGHRPARRVRLRVGSASDPADVDDETHREHVRPGESIPFADTGTYGSADDFSVTLTWRSFLGRKTWTQLLD